MIMFKVSNEEAGIKPFHLWKDEMVLHQEPLIVYPKEWYYQKYGQYCIEMRREAEKRLGR